MKTKLISSLQLTLAATISFVVASESFAAIGSSSNLTGQNTGFSSGLRGMSLLQNRILEAGNVIATNRDMNLGDLFLPKGTELVVGEEGTLSTITNSESVEEKVIDLGINIQDLTAEDYTVLQLDEETGELKDYNIPSDLQVAGRGRARKKRGGTTYCYRAVKQIVHRRITLTGVAAYMAAPQLRSAGWRHYSSYDSAPMGSVCVFGRGGRVTRSGGHKYGHVGVKGAGGIANPVEGFHLGRPFLGCWSER